MFYVHGQFLYHESNEYGCNGDQYRRLFSLKGVFCHVSLGNKRLKERDSSANSPPFISALSSFSSCTYIVTPLDQLCASFAFLFMRPNFFASLLCV
mmetsp:Transcript_20315/g.34693  ORF Transcript_20315/g.34693 Transcript_20315/m.34693 type:complete len:96 (+) Transcript_20315:483-770(+)